MDVITVFQIMNTAFLSVLGLVIGSFLNVCIYRIPQKRTIVKGHSMCMSCGHELGALDLIPLFSWIFLKGRCRYCKEPIASRYAKIEGLTCIVFGVLAWQRRESYYVPGLSDQDPVKFASLLILLALAALVITAMMIQKDHGTGMYRLSFGVLFLFALRAGLSATAAGGFFPVILSAAESLLIAVSILIILIVLSLDTLVPLRTFFSGLLKGKPFIRYFAPENRAARTTDFLFASVSTAIGFPASIPCLIAYAAIRSVGKQDILLPYRGVVIAAGALVGVLLFPGKIF